MNGGSTNRTTLLSVVVVLVIVISLAGLVSYGAYVYGQKIGYDSGYQKAQADIKAQQEALAKKATEEAAKAANPFKTADNPLQNVADPLEKTKNILNPF
ncbi:MAG: hypothetical protein HYT35_00480 [Candidatus Staskawiczbacteria bacterium]|nr:hypothetical protein [Candidatus Staskawiczbacteria bacterium]